ncbi:O-antigen flippase [Brenneria roseae subsp. roseae]|uniref:O-antigen translocase n=1 Tax=Brenneria roseae TaxID=1509241 RepID=UPI000D62208B|nr:O-antigen translocase [Brenneria roseae]PWC19123.1 O-antigen flippase [Brenneria roseae subsp. roseae]
MNLIKTSILSFIATAIKVLAGLVINKAIAMFVGPAGLALVGQFQNFSQIAMTAAKGAINSGVTKYIAEYGNNEEEKVPILISTSAKISIICSVIVGAFTIFFSNFASLHFLHDVKYQYIFVIFGFTIILFSLNQLILSILNGLREIKSFISINIIQSLYGLVFTTVLIVFWGIDGALIALVTNQSVVFLIVIWMLRKHAVIKWDNFLHRFDKVEGKKLLGFAAMALTSALTLPISQLIVRNYIVDKISWDAAGYWQAIWYISTMYLMVITTALSTYYLPRLSEIKERTELREELMNGYKIILPVVIVMSLSIFLLRDFIILVLFNNDFMAMRELFKWQLTGDVIKISSWLLAFILISKAEVKIVIFSEVIFSISFVLLSFMFIKQTNSVIGVTYAYVCNYIMHFFFMLTFVFYKKLV